MYLVINKFVILGFRISPCSECCILPVRWFPGLWIFMFRRFGTLSLFNLYRWYKLHTPPMKMEQADSYETSEYKIQTPGNNPKERIQICHSITFLSLLFPQTFNFRYRHFLVYKFKLTWGTFYRICSRSLLKHPVFNLVFSFCVSFSLDGLD